MRKNSQTTQLMALSLFVLILAFFIVLNAISDFREEKVLPVLASLEAAFASQLIGEGGLPSVQQQPDTQQKLDLFAGSALDALEVAFRNSFDLMSVSRPMDGRALSVTLSKDQLMALAQNPNSSGVQSFREKLAVVLNPQNGVPSPYATDFVVITRDTTTQDLNEVQTLLDAVDRIGIDSRLLAVQIEAGKDPNAIKWVFVPATPLQNKGTPTP